VALQTRPNLVFPIRNRADGSYLDQVMTPDCDAISLGKIITSAQEASHPKALGERFDAIIKSLAAQLAGERGWSQKVLSFSSRDRDFHLIGRDEDVFQGRGLSLQTNIKKVLYGNDYSLAMPNGSYRAFLGDSLGWSMDHSSGRIHEDPLLPVKPLKDSQVEDIQQAFQNAGLEKGTHYNIKD
jgi:hypothetical protein